VRLFLRRGLSVRYLLPAAVVDYIEDNGLYQEDTGVSGGGDKDRDASGSAKLEGKKVQT